MFAAFTLLLQLQLVPINGTVIDANTQLPVASAEIRIVDERGLARSTRSAENGAWRITGIGRGSYELEARSIGYEAQKQRIMVGDMTLPRILFSLKPVARSLDAVVVTAAGRAEQLGTTTIATEVVSRAEIDRSGSSDMASLLIEQTGVQLQGGHPAGAGVMLQGIGSERVLILVDGQPLAGRISGVLDVSRIPTAMVERIEVVKGPHSTLYGSEAMGGVVNIITRPPATDMVSMSTSLRAGSDARREGTIGINYGRGSFAAIAHGGFRGEDIAPGVHSNAGALAKRTDFAANATWHATNSTSLTAALIALDERQRWRSGSVYNFSDNQELSARAGVERQFSSGAAFSATAFTTVNDHLARGSILPEPIAGDEGDKQLQRVHRLELLYHTAPARLILDIGTHLRVDEIETERITGQQRSMSSVEPFAQLELSPLSRVTFLPGVRASYSSAWGTHVTPRVAARINASEALSLRGSVAAGYRAPDFKELYMFFQNTSAGYAVHGNPDLTPETSVNFSGSAELATSRISLLTQIFLNKFSDFIETQAVSAPGDALVFEYSNISNGRTSGADIEAAATAGPLRSEIGWSLLNTRDDATGKELLGRPRNSGRIHANLALNVGTRISVTTLFTGRTPMQRDETSGEIASWREEFFRTDVNLSQRLPFGAELHVGVDNIFDSSPAEWAGFTRRRSYAGLSWNTQRGAGR